jgi:thiamine-monophosphate kinase
MLLLIFQHILNKSSVGAVINVDALPLSAVMLKSVPLANAISFALSSGDDYELCFTVPENKLKMLELTLQNFSYTCIGTITDSLGLNLLSSDGQIYALKNNGYEHF